MQRRFVLPIWKEVPFLRLIQPLIAGILIEDTCNISITSCSYLFTISLCVIILLALLPVTKRYQIRQWKGVAIFISLFFTGLLITSTQKTPLQKNWIGHFNKKKAVFCAELSSPLIEKEKTYKITAIARQVFYDSVQIEVEDVITIYIEKDSVVPNVQIGDLVYFEKPLQSIKGTGNPGSFDFKRYSELQQCYFLVYLPNKTYAFYPGTPQKWKQLFQETRSWLVETIRKYIPSKKEAGLAEALLIAYKDDLDKTLVQSYANTGVVHIIAISGLHLGLIYWLLATLLNPISRFTKTKWIKPFGVIAGLWIFSLLAGASPSVLRSAVMFSFLAAGELFGKKTNAINNLAASAFLLLCFNPFWLWDTGFQLSYSAVLSLLLFMNPVYRILFIKNKWLDMLWKMNAVTISAQILTIPICIFYFHQFPNAFLLTNLIAVPLSSLILFLELALCAVAGFETIALFIGNILQWLLWGMNYFIETVSHLPYAVWEHLYLSILQTILLYVFIACISIWLFRKSKLGLIFGTSSLCVFIAARSIHMIETSKQKQLIVYNIPKKQAVDMFFGDRHIYYGDSSVSNSAFSNLSPLYLNRLQQNALATYKYELKPGTLYMIGDSIVIIYSSACSILPVAEKIKVSVLIISTNPITSPKEVLGAIDAGKIVLDASNNYKTVARWQKEASNLGIACHSVVDNGAFVINLP